MREFLRKWLGIYGAELRVRTELHAIYDLVDNLNLRMEHLAKRVDDCEALEARMIKHLPLKI